MLCPAVDPARVDDARVFGLVVDGRVRYLKEPEPITDEHRQAAAPARVDEVFRICGTCYQCKTHWTGTKCGLAPRIQTLVADPPVEGELPPCPIRSAGPNGCRHYAQEGEAVCRFCPGYVYAARVVVPAGRNACAPIADDERDRLWV
jgi:hypothetical protein